jgi:hypothetical protein
MEEVETFVIPAGENQTFNYEIIFIPDMAYKEIVLELQRESYDFQVEDGRKINIKNIVLNTINNILNNITRNLIIRKIGIQGPTGLTFIIDGEVVRIGRSGIYELYHDSLTISFIGVILNEGDSFIMDYKY